MVRYRLKQWYKNGVYVGSTSSSSKKYLLNLAKNQLARGRKVKLEVIKKRKKRK